MTEYASIAQDAINYILTLFWCQPSSPWRVTEPHQSPAGPYAALVLKTWWGMMPERIFSCPVEHFVG